MLNYPTDILKSLALAAMKFLISIVSLTLLFTGCKRQQEEGERDSSPSGRETVEIPSLHFDDLQDLLHEQNDEVHVVNFWATWCPPCVEELPFFEKLRKSQNVDVVLVSLDMPKMKDTHLKPFVKKHNLNSKVVLLDAPDSNMWIPKVNKKWSGALPATLIYKNDRQKFYARNFENYKDLLNEVKLLQ